MAAGPRSPRRPAPAPRPTRAARACRRRRPLVAAVAAIAVVPAGVTSRTTDHRRARGAAEAGAAAAASAPSASPAVGVLSCSAGSARARRTGHAGGFDAAGCRLGGLGPALTRCHRLGPVLDHALERADSPFGEVEPARQRLDPHLEVLQLDARPRRLEHQVVQHLVVEGVPRRAVDPRLAGRLDEVAVDLGLLVQDVDQLIRVEEQLQERVQPAADGPQQPTVRVVERAVLELVGGHRRQRRVFGRTAAAELLEQVGAEVLRIEELLEPDVGQLADLFLGVVDAALVADPAADLLHDLLDIDGVGSDVEIGHEMNPQALDSCSAWRRRLANSGASLMHVPRMPTD